MASYDQQRNEMVDRQIAARGVRDPAVLAAMRKVPREHFVDPAMKVSAYEDRPRPIGEGQTISQPYIVALMAEAAAIGPNNRVLKIGTGSGYVAAVLAEIAGSVFTIGRHEALVESARDVLTRLGYGNVVLRAGDGTRGWPEEAPFDAILVAAASPAVPESLKRQLAIGGRLVIPVGGFQQTLLRITRTGEDEWRDDDLGGVTFVPLIGEEGWEAPD